MGSNIGGAFRFRAFTRPFVPAAASWSSRDGRCDPPPSTKLRKIYQDRSFVRICAVVDPTHCFLGVVPELIGL